MSKVIKIIPGLSPRGIPELTVLSKMTYALRQEQRAELMSSSIPFCEKETWIGGNDPVRNPPRSESDMVPHKKGTDLIIHGRAFAPQGRRARFFDLTVAINDIHYQIRVIGNRRIEPTFTSFTFSEPELFEDMPLHYGLAYGGTDCITNPDFPLAYPRNPVGKGFVIDASTKDLIGLELPNLENPQQLLTPAVLRVGRYDRWISAPEPRALGYAPKNSYPRNSQEPNALGIWNAAPPRLCLPPLWGDESITLTYMDPLFSKFTFDMPGNAPTAWIRNGTRTMQRKYMMLQTVEIFKETNQMTLVWSASFEENMDTQGEFEFGVH